jgi:hypothetical protein
LERLSRCKYSLVLLWAASIFYSYADDSTDVSSTVIVRHQLKSIAQEVFAKSKFDPKVRVILNVEGDGPRSLAENSFIEIFNDQHFSSILLQRSIEEQTLSIYLLGVTVTSRQLDSKLFERRCQTKLDARTVTGLDHETQFIGTFHRESLDTVRTFSSFDFFPEQITDKSNLSQRLLTPLILIGGAILIVYLFFTVRS